MIPVLYVTPLGPLQIDVASKPHHLAQLFRAYMSSILLVLE
jgi:hypothetical protein